MVESRHNTEQRILNVFEIFQYDWVGLEDKTSQDDLYSLAGINLNSEQIRYSHHLHTVREKVYVYIYPHDTDNFVLIVPKEIKSKTEYNQILKSPLILVWIPAVAIMSIVRFIFNKIRKIAKSLVDISFEMFGLSLGMSFNAKISSAAENLLIWCYCLGTILAGMLLSSSMFQGFALQLDILTINNLEELDRPGLEVQAPIYSESVENFFDNIPQKVKLNYTQSYDISDMIASRNTSYAYVIPESKFNILFSDDEEIWHIIERFGFEYLSYKLSMFPSMENRMNTLIQRCVDHGIVKHLVEKNKRLLTGTKQSERSNDKEMISSNFNAISISDVVNPFLLFALGLVLSTITFIAEKIYFAKCY
ncbi:hypothetical protein Bhyg_08852 [Pseudolycoriella hygida]|uniref:Uncharacterized protein n=1 Tax=Pseudolycoriella hygida TaxID=35572 RepID=A0A9Q0S3C5_9DIPT|nr:hypothetical protein Bhyg_08852 [Pseudolycoriella hygida]